MSVEKVSASLAARCRGARAWADDHGPRSRIVDVDPGSGVRLRSDAQPHLAFARGTADELTLWMVATTPRRRAQRIAASLSGGGPSANAHWSVLAMIAVAAVWLTPGLLDSVTANVLAFLVVASSWTVTVYAYAVHDARLDAASTSLQFPGDGKPVFADYFYLSAQVATTFSSSDVTILTMVGRRVVTGQTLIAFVFTTFVIAMLLAVIFLSK